MSALSKILFAVLLAIASFNVAQSQDIHFSQYYHSPLHLNPALAGVHHGTVRFTGNYKSQWQSVSELDFLTFSAAVERKFYMENLKNSYFTAGLILDYDQAGTSQLSRTNVGVSGSYSLQLSPVFFMTAGAHVGVSQRAFKTIDLTFDQQFNGEQFDPNIAKEGFNRTSLLNVDVSTGLNFRLQPQGAHPINKRTKLDFGLGVFHLNEPREGFELGSDIRLNQRYSAYAMGTLMLSNTFDFIARGSVQLQGSYQENIVSGSGKIHINRQPTQELAFVLGSSYRFDNFGDAIIPHVEFHWKQWLLGLNYDVNISEFKAASGRQGGIEVAVRYIFAPLQPAEKTKACPII